MVAPAAPARGSPEEGAGLALYGCELEDVVQPHLLAGVVPPADVAAGAGVHGDAAFPECQIDLNEARSATVRARHRNYPFPGPNRPSEAIVGIGSDANFL
jgi:hypothetical protein